MVEAMEKLDPTSVGPRVRALIWKVGLTTDSAATFLKVQRSAVSNWINGYNLPQVGMMSDLMELLPGMTLDWIYRGDDRLIPGGLARELQIIMEAQRQGLRVPEVSPEPASPPARSARVPHRPTRKLASANG